jgi:hypothetical protein
MNDTIAYLPGLSPVENKELCARFDGGRLSSDGGVLLLRGIEKRLGLAARLASCLTDRRDPASTTHTYVDMIGARLFAIACGGACPRAGKAGPGGGLRRPRRSSLRSGLQAGLWASGRERS